MAVILASDMVGFSKAMGDDESGTLKKLKESRALMDKAIASHYGRIFNTSGDFSCIIPTICFRFAVSPSPFTIPEF